MAVYEGTKSSNNILMDEDEVASDVPPRYLLEYSPLAIKTFSAVPFKKKV